MGETLKIWWIQFCNGVRKLWYWAPIIWRDYDWDHVYLLHLMRHKLRAMHKELSRMLHPVYAKELRHIQVCIWLLDRLIEDDYGSQPDIAGRTYGHGWADHWQKHQAQDLQYLCRLLGKHLLKWWN
jgi:hypothetical protein